MYIYIYIYVCIIYSTFVTNLCRDKDKKIAAYRNVTFMTMFFEYVNQLPDLGVHSV